MLHGGGRCLQVFEIQLTYPVVKDQVGRDIGGQITQTGGGRTIVPMSHSMVEPHSRLRLCSNPRLFGVPREARGAWRSPRLGLRLRLHGIGSSAGFGAASRKHEQRWDQLTMWVLVLKAVGLHRYGFQERWFCCCHVNVPPRHLAAACIVSHQRRFPECCVQTMQTQQ